MSVRQYGHGPDPALMLHCTLAQGSAWAGVARGLEGRLRMVAPDLLSHGRAPGADRARDYHSQATEAAMAYLPDAPCHLMGHSFGATVALRIALARPEAIKSLTLIEPVLFCASDGPGRRAHDAGIGDLPGGYAGPDPKAIARHFIRLWSGEDFDALPPARQTYMLDRIWIPAATEPALIADNADLLARLPTLKTPTSLIEGALSPPVISEINARLAHDIPDVRRVAIDGAAHMAPITHPTQTAEAIADFLGTL